METILYIKEKNSIILKNLLSGAICTLDSHYFEKNDKKSVLEEIDKLTPFIQSVEKKEKSLSVVIVCTMNCNLRCSYCFEKDKERDSCLNSEIDTEHIILFLKSLLKNTKFTGLDICYTGGEPLINFELIEKVTREINKTFDKMKIEYSLITNGTLLTEKMLRFFDKNKFEIQISFDGNQREHDLKRKYLNNQGGTYLQIMHNLKIISQTCKNIFVKIRININSQNYRGIDSLLSDLEQVPFNSPVFVYPEFVSVASDEEDYVLNGDKVQIMKEVLRKIYETRFKTISFLSVGNFCMYKNETSITIHADGKLYKCYSLVGNESFVCGDMRDTDTIIIKGSGDLCDKTCAYKMICFGGCPYNTFVEHGKMEKECQFSYIDEMNKFIFIQELNKYNDYHFGESDVSKVKTFVVQ